jgi:Calpain family cysteine protease
MSLEAIATARSGEFPLNLTDTDSFDLASAGRHPKLPQLDETIPDSAARDSTEALSVSHAGATDGGFSAERLHDLWADWLRDIEHRATERHPRHSEFSATVQDSAAGYSAAAPSGSHAGATDTDTAAPGFLSELHNAHIRTDVADALGAHDSLSYHGMLQVLDAAAVGGMTAGKFHTLETLASLMNAPDGISTSAYVQHISHSLIDGDAANAEWTGGESTPVALGNLSATSTHAQVDDLIGKWFLGTDLPSMAGTGPTEATYEVHKAPLFAADGPSYHDVNQGSLGDCWFVATLAEVALQDPSAIESMITNNHNGTYGVRFFVDGAADYVTVNKELPTASAPLWENGSDLKFANGAAGTPQWAELVEKAFVQLNAEPDAVHGDTLGKATNAYLGIDDGYPQKALAEITGQTSDWYGSDNLVFDAAKIGAALDSGEEVELVSPKGAEDYSDHLVDSHIFSVIGYDASTEEFTLRNPWGSGAETEDSPMTFSMSAHELADAGCSMWVAQGAATGDHAPAHEMEAAIASHLAASHGPAGHFL